MNDDLLTDAALEALLRRDAPAPLAEGDFVVRTLAAVERATPAARRTRVVSPREIALALMLERRRAALQARLRRWGSGGVAAGMLLLALAMLLAPGGTGAAMAAAASHWVALWTALLAGAAWVTWQELSAQ